MNNIETINKLFDQLTTGLQTIMEQSYPNCKNSDSFISISNSKINNTAFELKKITMLLKQIVFNEKEH